MTSEETANAHPLGRADPGAAGIVEWCRNNGSAELSFVDQIADTLYGSANEKF